MNNSQSRNLYRSRIDKVILFITENISAKLNLEILAKVACFSPFHFHRIFTYVVGETPNDFVNRLRLEKSAYMLSYNINLSITEIALLCGFNSSASFSRSFKQYFGNSATEWRQNRVQFKIKDSWPQKIENGNHSNKNILEAVSIDEPELKRKYKHIWESLHEVNVKHMPAHHVVYLPNIGGYDVQKIEATWDRLLKWAEAHDLLTEETEGIGISFDDPAVTPREKCRYYACITVPPNYYPEDTVGVLDLAGGKHAMLRFEGKDNEVEIAYRAFFKIWLPESGYQPADRSSYEIYRQIPEKHPEEKFIIEIYLPVIPL